MDTNIATATDEDMMARTLLEGERRGLCLPSRFGLLFDTAENAVYDELGKPS